jgi:hypothetical protein
MDDKELAELEVSVTATLEAAIGEYVDYSDNRLHEIQPPTSVIRHAAQAAAQVHVAFERGYQMVGK